MPQILPVPIQHRRSLYSFATGWKQNMEPVAIYVYHEPASQDILKWNTEA